VRLLSPQALYKSVKGSDGHQDAVKYTLMMPNDVFLDAPYGTANLPILPMSSGDQVQCFWNQCFGFNVSDTDDWAKLITSAANQNLTPARKELLVWHHRLSHALLSTIHGLCRQRRKVKPDSDGKKPELVVPFLDGPSLPCKHNVPNAVCEGLLCAACAAAKSSRRAPGVRTTKSALAEMVLKQVHLKQGDCISCDHYISLVPGRVTAESGYSSSRHGYTCGTIYVDHASGFMFVGHQKSTSAAETIRSKLLMIEQEAKDVGVTIKKYHSDNGIFSSSEFKDHCKLLDQEQSFSGVGAKFQNAVAENGIKTVSNMARANMIHTQLHWPGRSFIDFWPLAILYAVWVHNHLPLNGFGPSPEELWSKIKCRHSHLPRAHAFRCPVYILDPKLQDGGKIPKWNSKVRQGIFVGFSPEHSTNVPLVFNPTTQHISPQFHVIFDDEFSTIPALASKIEHNETFELLYKSSRECFLDEDNLVQVPDLALNKDGEVIEGSDLLDDEWLLPQELAHRNQKRPVREGVPSMDPEGATSHQAPVRKATEGVYTDIGSRPVRTSQEAQRVASEAQRVASGPVTRSAAGRLRTALVNLLLMPQYALSAAHNVQPPPAVANIGGSHRKHVPSVSLWPS
jgi:hypothetical protein